MKTHVNINITTGYHVLSSGSAVNLFLSRYLEQKKNKQKTKKNKEKRSSTECSSSKANPFFTFECFEKTFAHSSKVALQDFCCVEKER